MGAAVSIQDVQSIVGPLFEAHESKTEVRHGAIMARLDKLDTLETRIVAIEKELAANRPVIRGATGAAVLLAAALVSGYVGSFFGS